MNVRQILFVIFILLLTGLLTACQAAGPESTSNTPTVETEPVVTFTPAAPTETPTPPIPKAILVLAEENPPSWSVSLQDTFERLAGEAGWQIEVVSTLTSADLLPSVKMVLVTTPVAALPDMVTSTPDTIFIAVGFPVLEPAGNLSLIGSEGDRPDYQGFLAGFIAAVVTEDWRVAAITASDIPASQAGGQAFLNGAEYYCGLCNPPFPPYEYPLLGELPASSSPAEWQAIVENLTSTDRAVQTFYLAGATVEEVLMSYLAGENLWVIGSRPPDAALRERWIATVRAHPAVVLEQIWPELLAGTAGHDLDMPVGYFDVNAEIFTPGRQRLVDQMLVELHAGLIDTGFSPDSGVLP